MGRRAASLEEARGAEQERARAHRDLERHRRRRFQPADELGVALQLARAPAAGHEDEVVAGERLVRQIRADAQAPVVGHLARRRAELPLEVRHDLHRFQARQRIVEADEVERRHAVEDDEARLHSASKYSTILRRAAASGIGPWPPARLSRM